jgi:hypothetical protein
MPEEKELKEAQVAYSAAAADSVEPIILKRDEQPLFAVLPFEEYRRLRDMASTPTKTKLKPRSRLPSMRCEKFAMGIVALIDIVVDSLGHEVAELQSSA